MVIISDNHASVLENDQVYCLKELIVAASAEWQDSTDYYPPPREVCAAAAHALLVGRPGAPKCSTGVFIMCKEGGCIMHNIPGLRMPICNNAARGKTGCSFLQEVFFVTPQETSDGFEMHQLARAVLYECHGQGVQVWVGVRSSQTHENIAALPSLRSSPRTLRRRGIEDSTQTADAVCSPCEQFLQSLTPCPGSAVQASIVAGPRTASRAGD